MAVSFIRTLLIFSILLLSMRLMGKRELGELELSELVVAVLVSDVAAQPLQDLSIPLLYGIIPILTLLCFELIISGLAAKNISFRMLVSGKPSMVIRNGTIDESSMRKNRFTVDELTTELRKKGITDISTVQTAVLETDGTLSVLLYPGDTPLTANGAGVSVPDPGYPVIVISDGRTLSENLRIMGKDDRWLNLQLQKRGIPSTKNVFIMTVDSLERIYIGMKETNK